MATTTQRIALVTGANKGIGLETARGLAQQGIHVLMGARDAQRGQAAADELKAQGLPVEFIHLDMADSTHFPRVQSYIASTFGKLDILVNNAGVMTEVSDFGQPNNAGTIPMTVLRETFDINFFGLVELTQILLPLVEKSEAGRIVNLSSILGSLALHATPGSPIYNTKLLAYNTTKTAVNAFTIHLAHALKDTVIKVNAAHPGWVKTDMGGKEIAPMEITDGALTSIQLATLDAHGPNGAFIHLQDTLPW
jgi:NAD(P)-dependent dehydrogenase (short-subunit alcohol dehydrogenase family)